MFGPLQFKWESINIIHTYLSWMGHITYSGSRVWSGIVSSLWRLGYELDSPRFHFRQGREIFLFSKMSRPVLGLIWPPTHWIPGFLPRAKELGCDVTTYHRLVPRLRMIGAVPLLPLYAIMVHIETASLFIRREEVWGLWVFTGDSQQWLSFLIECKTYIYM